MLLKVGSKGIEVKQIQQILGLEDDGSFGTITEARVKEWQTLHMLPADGIVDDEIWNKLLAERLLNNGNDVNIDFEPHRLKGYIPDSVLEQIPAVAEMFSINSILRLAHFLSQCGHESGNFKAVYENLSYSSDRLKVIFSKYFPGDLSEIYARNPVKIASRVYANRMGNGDEASQEGYKYRGRGYIQLTGRNNYAAFAGFIGEDTLSNPDLVATKYPLASAAFYFNSNKLWRICDGGATDEVVKALTLRINAGLNGLSDRLNHFNEYYHLLK